MTSTEREIRKQMEQMFEKLDDTGERLDALLEKVRTMKRDSLKPAFAPGCAPTEPEIPLYTQSEIQP